LVYLALGENVDKVLKLNTGQALILFQDLLVQFTSKDGFRKKPVDAKKEKQRKTPLIS
jgi:hypothetical protein